MRAQPMSGSISGVIVGTVKRTDDPRGEGRILVQIPWMEGRNQSYWAPPATLMSGGGRGSWFMPEKDDEVLLAFDRSAANHPYIIGFLWNGVDKPPESDPQQRVIVTPGGHALRFEDKEPGKKVILKSNGGHQVTLDDSPGGSSLTLKTNGGLCVILDDEGQRIELNGGGRTLRMQCGTVQIE
jgi:uncharacterized protein involved in type VI secretion and phage assembly